MQSRRSRDSSRAHADSRLQGAMFLQRRNTDLSADMPRPHPQTDQLRKPHIQDAASGRVLRPMGVRERVRPGLLQLLRRLRRDHQLHRGSSRDLWGRSGKRRRRDWLPVWAFFQLSKPEQSVRWVREKR